MEDGGKRMLIGAWWREGLGVDGRVVRYPPISCFWLVAPNSIICSESAMVCHSRETLLIFFFLKTSERAVVRFICLRGSRQMISYYSTSALSNEKTFSVPCDNVAYLSQGKKRFSPSQTVVKPGPTAVQLMQARFDGIVAGILAETSVCCRPVFDIEQMEV